VIWLHRYAVLLACATLLLIGAGGMVTSTSSGLSVPDWPTTYGYNMFTFPLAKMVGGIFYEHGHRLIASGVGMLTIGLVMYLWAKEPRRWVRRLGMMALAAVIVQGVLGGITVLYFLPDAVSIAHAGLAQLFFCMTVAIALFTSRSWQAPSRPPVDDADLRRRAVWVAAAVYGQILLGAAMRHTGAGLAIPDFPLAYGHLIPPGWSTPVAIHFAHRVGAVVVTALIVLLAARVLGRYREHPELTRPITVLLALVAIQITLGAYVIWTARHEVVNTLHVVTGSLVLVTSVAVALRAHRVKFAGDGASRRAPAAMPHPTAAAMSR
jgi:cytochrome c oxidase assembly protein subunit 15